MASDRSTNEFLSRLAHELRNPLAPISNAVTILKLKGDLSPEMNWALDVIARQTQQMTRLIDDLQDMVRMSSNKLELSKDRIELGDVLRTVVEASGPHMESRGLQFVVTMPAEPVHMDGDPARLAQAISKLLHNSAKFTERGGRVWLQAERQGADAVIIVRDTGIGIPAAALLRIFEKFAQPDGSLGKSPGGLGIGLTLAKRFIDMHGGTITAESDGPDQGSQFTIRLPAVPRP